MSSATVPAPARHTATVARAKQPRHVGFVPDELVVENVAVLAQGGKLRRARFDVAGTGDVVHGAVVAIAASGRTDRQWRG